MKNIILLCLTIFFIGCKEQSKEKEAKSTDTKENVKKKRPVALEDGKFFEANGKKMLYGVKMKISTLT